jgi:F-type H+-transporting ATPase subunit gamma
MSDTTASLRRKISSAGDLQSVVRTMKVLAASSITQYERSVGALRDYCRAVELGLGACFREHPPALPAGGPEAAARAGPCGAVVFGSDQGLVGQFNDLICDFALQTLAALPGERHIWAVGERVEARLIDAGVTPIGTFPVPGSVAAIAGLVGRIQVASEAHRAKGEYSQLYVFHNRPEAGAQYEPVSQRLLPLDAAWAAGLAKLPWPTKQRPQVWGGEGGTVTLRALLREYLYSSLFRACAESLASENASRLAAMQRADQNIRDLLESLQATLRQVRQTGIGEELLDVIAGFEAQSGAQPA